MILSAVHGGSVRCRPHQWPAWSSLSALWHAALPQHNSHQRSGQCLCLCVSALSQGVRALPNTHFEPSVEETWSLGSLVAFTWNALTPIIVLYFHVFGTEGQKYYMRPNIAITVHFLRYPICLSTWFLHVKPSRRHMSVFIYVSTWILLSLVPITVKHLKQSILQWLQCNNHPLQSNHVPPVGWTVMPRPSLCHTSSLQTPNDKAQALQLSVSDCISLCFLFPFVSLLLLSTADVLIKSPIL